MRARPLVRHRFLFGVRMLIPLPSLAVCLQAVTGFLEHRCHCPIRNGMILSRQFFRQYRRALASPTQRRFRMPTGGRIDQFFQRRKQLGVGFCQPLTPRTTTTKPVIDRLVRMCRPMVQFPHPGLDRIPRQSGGLRDGRHAAPAQSRCFRSCPLSAHAFVHHRRECNVLLTNPFERFCIMHTETIA